MMSLHRVRANNTELASNSDSLQPFIMSFETKNPKLISIAVGCFQKLISHQAVAPVSIN